MSLKTITTHDKNVPIMLQKCGFSPHVRIIRSKKILVLYNSWNKLPCFIIMSIKTKIIAPMTRCPDHASKGWIFTPC